MRKTIINTILLGMLLAANPAVAGHGDHEQVRGWIAESLQWRLSYLPTVRQTVDVINLSNGMPTGAAWMNRTKNGIQGRIMTGVDTAGDPYTVWIVVINNPGACADACVEADLGNPDTGSSAHYGSGAISAAADGGGVINVDFSNVAGNVADGQFVLFGDGEGQTSGIHRGNGMGAEVWLIVDIHARPAPGDSWVTDLTETIFVDADPLTLPNNHRGAFFPAAE